jgi:hypothetical protein
MPSFLSINYALRPNKNIERKLIGEVLQTLRSEFDISSYRYIGMGSLWFVDFTWFHRALRFSKMDSIEGEARWVPRMEFNKPLRCITVHNGETTYVLPKIALGSARAVVWLDYDKGLGAAPVFQDIQILCEELQSGSVVVITLNAHANQLRRQEPGGRIVPRVQVLGALLGRTPSQVPEEATTPNGYPPYLAAALIDRLRSVTRKAWGGQRAFRPLFNFRYADGAPMVTVGGMIVDEADGKRLDRCRLAEVLEFAQGDKQFEIRVPLLTAKEKAALDRLMPCPDMPSPEELAALGFPLDDADIEGYRRFYRYYPLFGELLS